MSSYFDTMGACIGDPQRFLELVRRQYRYYLSQLNEEVLIKDLQRLNDLIAEFEAIADSELGPEFTLQDFHDFAHKLATARIRLHGGGRATDNPRIPY